ncbi:hypothetical protein [Kamptonema formosum]|uniref:hypothetical protein n=1 Tax=Kamptonema formosum TaxID=331992 RepID=UPI00034512B0|nr:hypothetical protein [Oscillatoria sp. PCC 10802]
MAKSSFDGNSGLWGYVPIVLPVALGMVALVGASRIAAPVAVVLGLAWGWKRYQQQKKKQAHLNTIFYRLIQDNGGRITALDFAIKANLSGEEARQYLEERAVEFSAQFDVSEKGGVMYCFETTPAGERKEPAKQLESMPAAIEVAARESGSGAELPGMAVRPQAALPAENAQKETQPLEPVANPFCLPSPLNQAELARRFNVHANTVSKRKTQAEFPEWSRSKDPAGIAWEYSPATKTFSPLATGTGKSEAQ